MFLRGDVPSDTPGDDAHNTMQLCTRIGNHNYVTEWLLVECASGFTTPRVDYIQNSGSRRGEDVDGAHLGCDVV